jgi:hypothetical protein
LAAGVIEMKEKISWSRLVKEGRPFVNRIKILGSPKRSRRFFIEVTSKGPTPITDAFDSMKKGKEVKFGGCRTISMI